MAEQYTAGSRVLIEYPGLMAIKDYILNAAYMLQIHLYSQQEGLSDETLEEFEQFEYLYLDPETMTREKWEDTIKSWLRYFEIVTGVSRKRVVYEVYLVNDSLVVVDDHS